VSAPSAVASPATAQQVVESMLAALAAEDFDAVGQLLDENVVYDNVGLPTVRGRRRTLGVLRPIAKHSWLSFEVYLHAIAVNGDVVLTERTDVVLVGPVRLQFWVSGRFDVDNGRITLWRDAFDFLDCTKALVRGVLGALVPALRPRPPASLSAAPGR
jgi:limonene-1,2-epoxide hydrolase